MSVIVTDASHQFLICKGAFEEILACCSQIALPSGVSALTTSLIENVTAQVGDFNRHGFREVAVAYNPIVAQPAGTAFGVADEGDLILLGFLSFLDPPKASARAAVAELTNLAVQIKILTGDSDIITAHICEQVGIPTTHVLLGHQIAQMDDVALTHATEVCHVFTKLSPDQKERIIKCMQKNGHVVGFMGDGINDAPALRAADVGISVDSAVDIAKESSDIILLDQNLLVLNDGVIEGRKVFGNIIKYVRMAASSNFGNMFSIVGVSAFLPFVPMLPIQILLNNLLYDISQSTIPTDTVDSEWLQKPRRWEIGKLQRFILAIGPISSLFDYTTFLILLYFFGARTNPELFHTAWFIESIFSQTLVIHVIRTNKIPFIQSMASWQLTLSSSLILVVASWLSMSAYGAVFGFVPLPLNYWLALFGMMLAYIPLTQFVKSWYVRRYGI
jgi:Mg2+-importing ATPase